MQSEAPFDLITKRPNFYGFSGLDRSAHVREREGWLESLLAVTSTRIVPVWRAQSLVVEADGAAPRAGFLSASAHAHLVAKATHVAFLGEHGGVSHIAIDLSVVGEDELPALVDGHGAFMDLRRVGGLMDRFEGSVLAYARGLMHWHQRHRHCGVCGAPTAPVKGGHQRNCTNASCKAPSFPRTDPAVIMLVHDGDRALLGHNRIFLEGMYSTLAGFVEPGETLEEAVAREVYEETNIRVRDVRYHSSQPWPFPASIMLGFHAAAKTTDINLNDSELVDAQFFTRHELQNFESLGKRLPRLDSIARRLIEDWLAGLA